MERRGPVDPIVVVVAARKGLVRVRVGLWDTARAGGWHVGRLGDGVEL